MIDLRIVVPQHEDAALNDFLLQWRQARPEVDHDDPRKAMLNGVPR